ncbi:MAG: bifunctional UDP-N-acetylglucosamine diphosphorylase/glucosamine-1-phosphate N-acetyltransferase GlmU [Actinobacteria bacterium]|nr:bifunctional UDP-N-acetylglucosamine diphosphorylase/glucosamine-1-phosphate N-acetyltransferase GlmU [Actinomycetota bacterium]
MKSALPKVLHRAAGRPLLVHVLASLQGLALEGRIVVAPARWQEMKAACLAGGFDEGLAWAVQDPPLGTADAVRVALLESGASEGTALVVNGGSPLITTETLRRLLEHHGAAGPGASLLTARLPDPTGYGRILRGHGAEVEGIIEERDATDLQRSIDEINAGVYVFDIAKLLDALDKVDDANSQSEYYITDVVGLLRSFGEHVLTVPTDAGEVLGIKSRAHVARAGELLRLRACERWLSEGVTIIDPRTTFIDSTVVIGHDAVIHPFTFLEGDTTVGEGAEVGPQTRIVNSSLASGSSVTFSVVKESSIGEGATVGPFASLRAGTVLERGAHVGTFVETKKTTIGEDSKAGHLTYLGDAEIGRGVNVGAGSITANWDGRGKNKTVIEDDAYIGSDTTMVAPVRIGRRAATGAGAVVRDDVADDALAVGVPARVIKDKGDRMSKGDKDATS